MAHDGVVRTVKGVRTKFEPTQLAIIGSGIHHADLVHGTLRKNTQYVWRRYAAEFEPERLPIPPSPAVEVGDSETDRILPRPDERTLPEKLHDHRAVLEGKEKVLGMQQERPFGEPPEGLGSGDVYQERQHPESIPFHSERPRVRLRHRP